MNPDDHLCLCFHVSLRKVKNFIRIEKPKRASQLSQCYGAGTGCGWCRPFLERLLRQHSETELHSMDSPNLEGRVEVIDRQGYAQARQAHIDSGKGQPPSPPTE